MAAEYVLKEGNADVMLCERGIRTFETGYRFTLDLMAVPVLKELTHLPVIVDPSHAAGRRDLVPPLSMAAAAARARTASSSRCTPIPTRRSATGPSSCAPRSFADYLRQVERAAELAGKELGSVTWRWPSAAPRDRVRDQRIERVVPLVTPALMLHELPLAPERDDVVLRGRDRDRRHPRPRRTTACWWWWGRAACTTWTAALDYARAGWPRRPRSWSDDLCVAMRVYFEKPRTTTGWKGMINDPHLDGSGDVNDGPADGAQAAARGARAGPAGGLRVPRPDHARSTSPTPWPGARSARAPPRARSTASSARACRCRSASRTAPTATCRWRWTRSARPRCRTHSPAST